MTPDSYIKAEKRREKISYSAFYNRDVEMVGKRGSFPTQSSSLFASVIDPLKAAARSNLCLIQERSIEIENNMELKDCVCFCLLTVLSYEVPKVE